MTFLKQVGKSFTGPHGEFLDANLARIFNNTTQDKEVTKDLEGTI